MKAILKILIVIILSIGMHTFAQSPNLYFGKNKSKIRKELNSFNDYHIINYSTENTLVYKNNNNKLIYVFYINSNYNLFKPKYICYKIIFITSEDDAVKFIEDKSKQDCWLYLGNDCWKYDSDNTSILIKKRLNNYNEVEFIYTEI